MWEAGLGDGAVRRAADELSQTIRRGSDTHKTWLPRCERGGGCRLL